MAEDNSRSDRSADPRDGAVSPRRRALVETARERWVDNLIDVSRRNNLLYFRDLKNGTLDLGEIDPESRAKLMDGDSVSLTGLLPDADPDEIGKRARGIQRRALANEEEKGLQTLFLSIGMATWYPADGGRPPEAPILLVPVEIERRSTAGRPFALRRAGELQVNLTLLHALDTLGCSIKPEALLDSDSTAVAESESSGDRENDVDAEGVFTRLRAAAKGLAGFTITARVVLGNFSFQKMAMVRDLRERGEEMAAHDLIAALVGDPSARAALQQERATIDPRELDSIPPEAEFLVLDADSSQQAVTQAVLKDRSGVIQGPPGTGKSQTIANLIAALVGAGQSVLFVAEKRAALEVVLKRLESVELQHLVLDLHRADVSRRSIMKQLGDALTEVRSTPAVDGAGLHARFVEQRQTLNAHDAQINLPRPPSSQSIYEIMGRLLQIPPVARTRSMRWRGDELRRLDVATATELRNLFAEAAGFGRLFLGDSPSPWANARVATGDQVQQAVDLVQRLRDDQWPSLRGALASACSATGLPLPGTLGDVEQTVRLFGEVAETLKVYEAGVYQADLVNWGAILAPANRWLLPRTIADWFNRGYREVKAKARALRKGGKVGAARIRGEVLAAADQAARWRDRAGAAATPVKCPGATDLGRQLDLARESLRSLAPLLDDCHGLVSPDGLAMEALEDLFDQLAGDPTTPYRLPRIHEIRDEIERRGAGRLLEELRTGPHDPSHWSLAFEHAWLSSCLDQARATDPSLAGFNRQTQEGVVEGFAESDRQRIRLSADRVRRAHAERVIAVRNARPEQDALIQREVLKRSRHLPLRALLDRAPDVLTAVCPCWMASPLAVSQLIDADRQVFDVVIFDEASQVLPEDAVPALLRARRAVVAGDRHQLPPTTFFSVDSEDSGDGEGDEATVGFESILDLMGAVFAPAWRLQWHYRSRDEALIAFSNQEIYDRGLIIFPSRGGEPAVSQVLVTTEAGRDGEEISPVEEVQTVVDLILEHARTRPNESLGVITLGITHAERVQAGLDQALAQQPELDEFFDERKPDRFFVKNLERVQGDERDAIILSIGCGKDRAGRVSRTQFGPLNSRNVGPRRLNVAITRARGRMTVVSAFTHEDLALSPSGDTGTDLLRKYLEYAASGGRRLSTDGSTRVPPNAFELDIQEALSAKGMKLRSQWGVSSYRIDLVAEHPDHPGRFVLAIECDGASYHSAPTARDRDRLRQQHLEALGWHFHRIWSTDWFTRRDEEIERALAAYRAAVASADAPVADEPPPPSDPVAVVRKTGGPRPAIPHRDEIGQYTADEIDRLIAWLDSDGELRTDEEIITRMVSELGFGRRGTRIEAAIRAGLRRRRVMGTQLGA